jgi:hypothetical protein
MTPFFALFFLSLIFPIHTLPLWSQSFICKKVFFFSLLSISTKCLLFSNHFHSLESVLKCVRVFYIIFMFVSLYSTPSVLFFYVSCPLHFCKLQISWPFYIFVLHVYTCKVNIDIFSIHENVLFLTGTKVQFWTEKKII